MYSEWSSDYNLERKIAKATKRIGRAIFDTSAELYHAGTLVEEKHMFTNCRLWIAMLGTSQHLSRGSRYQSLASGDRHTAYSI
jgi:hypothetical protein